ncbi:hypothetical protein LCGC14_1705840, partial [marine sediment metagenome]
LNSLEEFIVIVRQGAAWRELSRNIKDRGQGVGTQAITIATGTVTPANGVHRIVLEHEGGGPADTLTDIEVDGQGVGAIIVVQAATDHDMTITHTGSPTNGKIALKDGNDVVLLETDESITLVQIGTAWQEISRNLRRRGVTVKLNTAEAITQNVLTEVPWDEVIDELGSYGTGGGSNDWWDSGAAGHIVIPTGVNRVRVCVQVQREVSVSGTSHFLQTQLNDADYEGMIFYESGGTSGSDMAYGGCAPPIDVVGGTDIITLDVQHNASAPKDLCDLDLDHCWFSVWMVD